MGQLPNDFLCWRLAAHRKKFRVLRLEPFESHHHSLPGKPDQQHRHLGIFLCYSRLVSNPVSNVPAVLLLKSIAASFRDPTARWRVGLNFWEYTRVGLVITLLSLTLGTLWLQIFFW